MTHVPTLEDVRVTKGEVQRAGEYVDIPDINDGGQVWLHFRIEDDELKVTHTAKSVRAGPIKPSFDSDKDFVNWLLQSNIDPYRGYLVLGTGENERYSWTCSEGIIICEYNPLRGEVETGDVWVEGSEVFVGDIYERFVGE